jgi:hypothetical protein
MSSAGTVRYTGNPGLLPIYHQQKRNARKKGAKAPFFRQA